VGGSRREHARAFAKSSGAAMVMAAEVGLGMARLGVREAGTLLAEVAQEEEEKAEAAADHGGGTSNTTS
jgi:hypothetical protein